MSVSHKIKDIGSTDAKSAIGYELLLENRKRVTNYWNPTPIEWTPGIEF